MIALFSQILLSYPIRFISDRLARYSYSILFGTILQYLVYSSSIIWIHLFSLAMYILITLMPKQCGGPVTFLSMVFLSWYHLNAILYRYGE